MTTITLDELETPSGINTSGATPAEVNTDPTPTPAVSTDTPATESVTEPPTSESSSAPPAAADDNDDKDNDDRSSVSNAMPPTLRRTLRAPAAPAASCLGTHIWLRACKHNEAIGRDQNIRRGLKAVQRRAGCRNPSSIASDARVHPILVHVTVEHFPP